jgi:hypothetical protein
MSWTVPSAGGPCPSFALVLPITGGELAYMVNDTSPAIVCDDVPIVVVDGNALVSNFTIVPSAGGPCPFLATVVPITGGELAYMVNAASPAVVCADTPIVVVAGNPLVSNFTIVPTATDASRQFLGIGPIGDVDFVLAIDEDRVLYLSDTVQPYLILQEVMETP